MAGRCLCDEGILPLRADTKLPVVKEPLVWLAQQSAFMVNSSGTACRNIRESLRQASLERGWGRGCLLDHIKLAHGVENRFGREALEWLGVPVWTDGQPAVWIRRLLNGQLQGQKRSPSIHFLLVLGALYESVEIFEQSILYGATSRTFTSPSISGSAYPPWGEEFFRLLKSAECGLPGISKRIGVPVYKLVEEARRRHWRVILSRQTRKKVGDQTVIAVKEDLRQGIEKITIMRRYGCSEWALTLIELDEPGLNDRYWNSARMRTREKNRRRLREYLAIHPSATRSDILRDLSGVYDALVTNDKEWFFEHIPKKSVTRTVCCKARVDWDALDNQKQLEVQNIIEQMLATGAKPVQVTATAVLKKAQLLSKYNNNPRKFELVRQVLQTRCEGHSEFLQRRVAWAVGQMASKAEPISVNKLRRLAGVPAHIVRKHKQLVIDVAGGLSAIINGRSFFSQ
ncbi:TnsD family Tn7-like transposition protein [Geomonas terrae]|nr:TnsD family Tn7-like transposition protein [Geomonas terrae]